MAVGRSELLKLHFGDEEAENLLWNIHAFGVPFFFPLMDHKSMVTFSEVYGEFYTFSVLIACPKKTMRLPHPGILLLIWPRK